MMGNGTEQAGRSAKKSADPDAPITIKKYANRRLYNTATSTYVTLDYLSEMVKSGQDFVVFDAKTSEDITRSVLTQIIFEEENKGQNLLPIKFLRQLIKFYGDNLQSFVPSYLEMSMNAFSENQEKIRGQMREAFGATPGYNMIEETTRRNMALFDQAMRMFNPMASGMGNFYGQNGAPSNGEAAPAKEAPHPDEIASLQARIAELEAMLKDKE